ncbi:MAG: VPLPA-CTERM sorting domain-containing protein [Roseicyclus sp.]
MEFGKIVLAAAIGCLFAMGSTAYASTLKALVLQGDVECSADDLTVSLDCEGAFSGNDSNTDLDGLFSKNGWTELAKVDDASGTDGDLTVTQDDNTATSGGWSYTGDVSAYSHMIAVLKGGNSFSAYLLDLSVKPLEGAWNTDGIAKGNGKPGPGLSHFGLYTIDAVPSQVPLPAAAWMLLAGLGGLVAMKWRKDAAA